MHAHTYIHICMHDTHKQSHTHTHTHTQLQVPFARFVTQQEISYLKRCTISRVFHESRVLGSHPREQYEGVFDIVVPSGGRLEVTGGPFTVPLILSPSTACYLML